MTKEIFEKLKEFEQKFEYAVKYDFISMDSGEFARLAELYKEHYGVVLSKSQMTCNTCRLKAMKRLGADWFAAKEVWDKPKKGKKNNGK